MSNENTTGADTTSDLATVRQNQGNDPVDSDRIKSIACVLVYRMIDTGEIEATEEAIFAAMPGALANAQTAVSAANDFL